MKILDTINKLCKPAYVYLVISVIGMIVLILQNMGNQGKYCVGTFNCNVPHNGLVFLGQGLYIALWTWILHYICRKGYKKVRHAADPTRRIGVIEGLFSSHRGRNLARR